ncbi:MAG TPA: hypothetical protein VMG12_16455 [Polyangiaceae bacterium]|nr:hypothetical protein [Polyangiaceae bacterium]
MKSIEFYDLPRPIQERFVAAAQASLAPAPLAIKLGSRFVGARWFIASLVLLALTVWYAREGFGDLEHPGAIASGTHMLLYCVGFALSFACAMRGLTLRDRALSLPFARATYLFPVGVVDAMSSSIRIHSLAELSAVVARADALEITFKDGASFEFPAKDQKQADAAKDAVTESQQRLDEATRTDNVRHLAALDPLCQTNFPSPFSQDVPFKRPTALWAFALLTMALASGAALGFGVWEVRNKLSARRIAETARTLDSTTAYRTYIERGGQLPEIIDVLLPRAELGEAKAQGNVAAIEQFMATHPGSKIQGEVDDALRASLLSALDKAKAEGTLAALERFATEHPSHAPVSSDVAEARHAVYVAAAERARSMVAGGAKGDAADFIERLVAYAEQHGPQVVLQFRSYLGKSCEQADKLVRGSSYFAGNGTLPSRYFTPQLMREREALAATPLLAALQQLFSTEIVKLELGTALPSPEPGERPPPLPEPGVPTLFIDHRAELSGGQTIAKPRGMFFGAGITFETSFVIPGDKRELGISVPTWRSPARDVMQHKKRTVADVYEDLVRRSFAMFARRYLDRMLRTPPEKISIPDIELPPEEPDASGRAAEQPASARAG